MNIKKIILILSFFALLIIGIRLVVIPRLGVPIQRSVESSDLDKFESIDIRLSGMNSNLLYSFIPDGSGVIYIEDAKGRNTPESAKYIFYYLNFKKAKKEKIHEVTLHEDFRGELPFIYWLDKDLLLMGAQVYLGLCGPENPSGTALFNLRTKEKIPINCITRGRKENSSIYFQKFLKFYADYSNNKNFYRSYKLKYSTQYSNASYILVDSSLPSYLFGNYIDDRVTSKEKSAYKEFDKISKNALVNKQIQTQTYPQIYDRKIYSREREYYFVLKNVDYQGCAAVDCDQKQYLELYDLNNELIKNLYLGKVGMATIGAAYTGYVDFWSNDNKVVLVKNAGARDWFRLYLISPN